MRLIVLKPDSLQVLRDQLKAASTAGDNTPIDRLKALNPHIDFTRLGAGAVLFVPDGPELAQPGSRSIDGGSFDDFANELAEGLKSTVARARAGYEQGSADRSDVATVLKTAAVKRLVESDAALKAQLDEVATQFATDQRDAKEAIATLDAMQKSAATELAALAKLFPAQ